jgi:hypothetical protein
MKFDISISDFDPIYSNWMIQFILIACHIEIDAILIAHILNPQEGVLMG